MMSIIQEQHDKIETMHEDMMDRMQTSFMCTQALNQKLSRKIETMQGDMMQVIRMQGDMLHMQDMICNNARETQAINAGPRVYQIKDPDRYLSRQIETMQGDMMQAMQDSMSCVSRETQAVNAKLSRQIETMQSDMHALVPFMQMIRHHIEHHVTVDHNVYQISAQNLTVGGPLPFIRPPHEPEPAEAPPRNFPMSVHTPDRFVPFSGSSFTLTSSSM